MSFFNDLHDCLLLLLPARDLSPVSDEDLVERLLAGVDGLRGVDLLPPLGLEGGREAGEHGRGRPQEFRHGQHDGGGLLTQEQRLLTLSFSDS